MAHTVEIKEIINGVQITETIDADIVVKLISYQSKPFLRTTNESAEETYQVLDIVGEIYNTPALATDFRITDKNGAVFIPANGIQLIEYSKKIRAFRPDDDGFSYHIGEITGTSNSITIGLADDNVNWAYIDGSFYEKYYPDTFNFTPVDPDETKTFLIYAKADSQTFYLTQSTGIPPGTYLIASVTVNEAGIDIIQATSGFREKSVDNFAIYSVPSGDNIIGFGANMRLKVQSAGAIRIGGFYNEEDKIYNGCPISVRNDTPFPMEFYNAVDASPEFIAINSADLPFSIKPGETANFAYRGGGIVEIIKTGTTGDLTLEQARLNGNVLEGDVEISIPDDETLMKFFVANATFYAQFQFSQGGLDWSYSKIDGFFSSIGLTENGIIVNISNPQSKGQIGNQEFNKQGDRKAYAQLGDVYDAITTETNARIAADKIETVVIALSPFNEDLLDNTSRLGMGVLTFPIKVLSFQTSAFPVPTGSGISTDLRKNGTSVATSVISAGTSHSTGNAPPTFSDDTFAIGDRLNFFTPTGGVGSTVKGQNLVATLIIQRL